MLNCIPSNQCKLFIKPAATQIAFSKWSFTGSGLSKVVFYWFSSADIHSIIVDMRVVQQRLQQRLVTPAFIASSTF